MARSDPSRPSLLAFVGTTFGKLVALVVLVALSGVACGLAFGYPVGKLDLEVSTAKQLDHQALVGTFDLEQALVQPSDLPTGWVPTEQSFAAFSLFGQAGQFCGETADQSTRLGDPLERSYVGPESQVVLLSEVAQFRKVQDAYTYLRDVTKNLGACRSFVRRFGDKQSKVQIRDNLGDGPVTDYVARSLSSVDDGAVQVVIMFQLGSVVVALQYVGPTKPSDGLLDSLQKEMLARLAPADFGKTKAIAGEEPVPTEPTTSTSTTTTTTTLVPPPTSTTTTIKRKPKPKPTAAPTTAAPAPAPTPAPTPASVVPPAPAAGP